MDNYNQLVQRIASAAGVASEEIERKVEAKRAKLSGLVSKEGAAQIVAAELGVNFDQEQLKLSELVHGMKRVNVKGKVLEVYPVREFNKQGREGKVVNMLIGDDSAAARLVFWDTNHIALVENGEIKEGVVLEISNGNVRNGEVHLSSFSDVKKSADKMEGVVEAMSFKMKNLIDIKSGEQMKTRAFVVQAFEPRYFEVCPQCRKKAVDGKCAEHGAVKAEKRALLTLVMDDGTESLRAVLFGEHIGKVGLSDEEIFDVEKFKGCKDGLLGQELMFSGRIRSNELFNTTEMIVDGIDKVDVGELVKELEAKA